MQTPYKVNQKIPATSPETGLLPVSIVVPAGKPRNIVMRKSGQVGHSESNAGMTLPNIRASARIGPHDREVYEIIVGTTIGDCYLDVVKVKMEVGLCEGEGYRTQVVTGESVTVRILQSGGHPGREVESLIPQESVDRTPYVD